MWIEYNPNPANKRTDDCVIRALSKALDIEWRTAFMKLSIKAIQLSDMMHKNYVWGDLLIDNGYSRYAIPNTCPQCYTISNFAADHPRGRYIVGTGEHVVCVDNGDWYDTWDSGEQVAIIYYWRNDNGIS